MRHLLLHPTHKKLVRMMRERVKSGRPIILTESDIEDFRALCQGTITMMKRHQGIYRILLTAANRPISEIDNTKKVHLIEDRLVYVIEKSFAKAEWRHLGTTIIRGFIVPSLQSIVNKQRRKEIG